MKKSVLFSTLLVIVLSCMSNIKAKTYLERKADFLYSAASPQINFNIDELPSDEHIGVSTARNVIGFCQECAHYCLRRKRVTGQCTSFICHCSIRDVGL
ncbi:PREDICTED: defensin-like protein 222 [Camelina sativa]|uniref:Defensin-like protein 222 n=1 Tax=Camelina sativa TaxID=90675 RepID=A0ABM0ZC66_CAMSA|nr:PREDICTED: defensin-like protein 222 [Camelina sativa]